ncbi:hypothetical protein AAG570_008678 [Ranatra chinensis]|uniref:Uncharacterized protein n=1 Tax=Ranatra chinensis TaxID=642074 RepID=A0ABD0YRK1_9HEMI
MGLMLSVLVFSVGVVEALSCLDHFRRGYVPLRVAAQRKKAASANLPAVGQTSECHDPILSQHADSNLTSIPEPAATPPNEFYSALPDVEATCPELVGSENVASKETPGQKLGESTETPLVQEQNALTADDVNFFKCFKKQVSNSDFEPPESCKIVAPEELQSVGEESRESDVTFFKCFQKQISSSDLEFAGRAAGEDHAAHAAPVHEQIIEEYPLQQSPVQLMDSHDINLPVATKTEFQPRSHSLESSHTDKTLGFDHSEYKATGDIIDPALPQGDTFGHETEIWEVCQNYRLPEDQVSYLIDETRTSDVGVHLEDALGSVYVADLIDSEAMAPDTATGITALEELTPGGEVRDEEICKEEVAFAHDAESLSEMQLLCSNVEEHSYEPTESRETTEMLAKEIEIEEECNEEINTSSDFEDVKTADHIFMDDKAAIPEKEDVEEIRRMAEEVMEEKRLLDLKDGRSKEEEKISGPEPQAEIICLQDDDKMLTVGIPEIKPSGTKDASHPDESHVCVDRKEECAIHKEAPTKIMPTGADCGVLDEDAADLTELIGHFEPIELCSANEVIHTTVEVLGQPTLSEVKSDRASAILTVLSEEDEMIESSEYLNHPEEVGAYPENGISQTERGHVQTILSTGNNHEVTATELKESKEILGSSDEIGDHDLIEIVRTGTDLQQATREMLKEDLEHETIESELLAIGSTSEPCGDGITRDLMAEDVLPANQKNPNIEKAVEGSISQQKIITSSGRDEEMEASSEEEIAYGSEEESEQDEECLESEDAIYQREKCDATQVEGKDKVEEESDVGIDMKRTCQDTVPTKEGDIIQNLLRARSVEEEISSGDEEVGVEVEEVEEEIGEEVDEEEIEEISYEEEVEEEVEEAPVHLGLAHSREVEEIEAKSPDVPSLKATTPVSAGRTLREDLECEEDVEEDEESYEDEDGDHIEVISSKVSSESSDHKESPKSEKVLHRSISDHTEVIKSPPSDETSHETICEVEGALCTETGVSEKNQSFSEPAETQKGITRKENTIEIGSGSSGTARSSEDIDCAKGEKEDSFERSKGNVKVEPDVSQISFQDKGQRQVELHRDHSSDETRSSEEEEDINEAIDVAPRSTSRTGEAGGSQDQAFWVRDLHHHHDD